MLTTTQSYVTYQGNGATTTFPFNFIVPSVSDLVVSITNNNVNPAVTTILSATQYSVTGIGTGAEFSGGSGPGGNVTYPVSGSPLPAGWSITIQRVVSYTQDTSLTNQGAFYPQVVEACLDDLTMQTQQLAAAMSAAVPFVAGLNVPSQTSLGLATPQQYGAAANGTTDDTAAFQAAVNANRVVFVPPAAYLIAGQVVMPIGCHLIGASSDATLSERGVSYLGAGSIIYVTNNSASPFVYTSSNEFRGLTLYYPNQLITAATPTVYPATFAPTASPPDAGATINFVRWKDCQAINAYDFINAVVPQGGFEYDDLTIGALHVGINSDGSGGGPEIGKIVFSYWQWGAGAAVTWAASNATNLILGRSDGFSIRRMIGGACKIGLLTQYSTISGWSAYFPWGQISNMDIDAAQIGWQNQASDITVSNFRGNNLLYDYYVPSGFSNATAAYFSNIDCSGGTQTYNFYVHSQGRLNINGGSLYMNGATNCIKMDAGGWFTLNGVQFLGSSSPLAISPAITELILLGNSFQSAPTLTSPPATNYRFVGNMNLSDH